MLLDFSDHTRTGISKLINHHFVGSVYMNAVCSMCTGLGHIGGLTNPCPGAENVEPVIINTGGPPLPRKRAP